MEKSTCFSLWILCATIVLQRKEYKEGKDREFMEREQEMARELLKGAYDLHVHSAPSHVKRALNDYELMEHAAETAVEVVVMLICASAMLTVFFYLFTSMPQLGV